MGLDTIDRGYLRVCLAMQIEDARNGIALVMWHVDGDLVTVSRDISAKLKV